MKKLLSLIRLLFDLYAFCRFLQLVNAFVWYLVTAGKTATTFPWKLDTINCSKHSRGLGFTRIYNYAMQLQLTERPLRLRYVYYDVGRSFI